MQTLLNHKKKIVVLILVVIVAAVWFELSSSSMPWNELSVSNHPQLPLDPSIFAEPTSLVDLSVNMESDLGLQDVMISEAAGGVLEIRAKDPAASKENLAAGTAYIFGYVEPFVGKDIKKVRVIYTANNFDATLFEASLADISSWKNKTIDDAAFAKKITFADLTKK